MADRDKLRYAAVAAAVTVAALVAVLAGTKHALADASAGSDGGLSGKNSDLKMVGTTIWIFRSYGDKATNPGVVDIYQSFGTLNLHAAQPWNNGAHKEHDAGMLLDRSVWWITLTLIFMVALRLVMTALRRNHMPNIMRMSEAGTVAAEATSKRFDVLFPRIEADTLRLLMIPCTVTATAYLGEGFAGEHSEHKEFKNSLGFPAALYAYGLATCGMLIQLYVSLFLPYKARHVAPASLVSFSFDDLSTTAALTERASSYVAKFQRKLSEHAGFRSTGYWTSPNQFRTKSEMLYFVERFGSFVQPVKNLHGATMMNIVRVMPAYADLIRYSLRGMAVMACGSAGAAGGSRASSTSIAAFLLMGDAFVVVAIRPYHAILTSLCNAWVSFCIACGFWSLTGHFENSDGDDTPIAASWHVMAVVSSGLCEGVIIAVALMKSRTFGSGTTKASTIGTLSP